ncbi:MAG: lipopolysaccharide heptosyltransferase II [Verrucomicrobiales bacterium]|nr:lipopolysaccharide heptosyltransferase II [Verrucomicrobiales bacterium]
MNAEGEPESSRSDQPKRFLVRSPNPLGDACMSLPAVRALKRSGPHVKISVCCRANLAPMWAAREEIDEVIPFSRDLNPFQVGRLLRKHGKFDYGVLLPNSFRSALELWLGGVGKLVGYNRHQRSLLLKQAVSEPESLETRHHVHRYLHLVEAMGIDISDIDSLLAIPDAPTPIQGGEKEIYLGVCPGAEYGNAKRYPIRRYAEAIEKLRKKKPDVNFRVSIFGSPAERPIGDELKALISDPSENRAGKTSIDDLVAELQSCHFLATNDTGTMHLAAALGVPTVAIFGSTEPAFTSPIGNVHRVIRHQVGCSPCFLRECPVDYRCMLRIEPETVVREMEALLEGLPQGAESKA